MRRARIRRQRPFLDADTLSPFYYHRLGSMQRRVDAEFTTNTISRESGTRHQLCCTKKQCMLAVRPFETKLAAAVKKNQDETWQRWHKSAFYSNRISSHATLGC